MVLDQEELEKISWLLREAIEYARRINGTLGMLGPPLIIEKLEQVRSLLSDIEARQSSKQE